MDNVWETIARTAAAIGGGLLLYTAFFTYEDEEGRIKNSLEELWIHVEDRSDRFSTWVRSLLGGAARIAKSAFDRLFGEKLFSLQALTVSFWYGLISLVFYPIDFRAVDADRPGWYWPVVAGYLVMGTLPAIFRSRGVVRSVFALTILLCLLAFAGIALEDLGHAEDERSGNMVAFTVVVAALFASVLLDIGWIYLVRRTLASTDAAPTFRRVILSFGLSALALGIGLAPMALGDPFELVSDLQLDFTEDDGRSNVMIFVAVLLMSRLFLIASALACFVILAIVLAHRIFWPVLARVVYAIARHELMKNGKLLGTCGFALLGFGLWNSPIVDALARVFGLTPG